MRYVLFTLLLLGVVSTLHEKPVGGNNVAIYYEDLLGREILPAQTHSLSGDWLFAELNYEDATGREILLMHKSSLSGEWTHLADHETPPTSIKKEATNGSDHGS